MPGSPTCSIASDTNISIESSFVDVAQLLQTNNSMAEEAFTDIKDNGLFVAGEVNNTKVDGLQLVESSSNGASTGLVTSKKDHDPSLTEVTQSLYELTCLSKGKHVSQDLFRSLEQTKYRLQLLQEELRSCRYRLGLPMASSDKKTHEMTSRDTLQIRRARLIEQVSAILHENTGDSDGSISTFHSEGSDPDTEEISQDSSLNSKRGGSAPTVGPSTTISKSSNASPPTPSVGEIGHLVFKHVHSRAFVGRNLKSQSWSAVGDRTQIDRMISIGSKNSFTVPNSLRNQLEDWGHEDSHSLLSQRKKVQRRSSRRGLQPSSASIRSLPREISWVVEEETKLSCPRETTIGSSTATKRGLLAVKSAHEYDDLPRNRRRRAIMRPCYRGASLQAPSPSIKSLPREIEIGWNVQDGDP